MLPWEWSHVRRSTQIGSSLVSIKYQPCVQVLHSYKHSSLLQCIIIYGRKKFYNSVTDSTLFFKNKSMMEVLKIHMVRRGGKANILQQSCDEK